MARDVKAIGMEFNNSGDEDTRSCAVPLSDEVSAEQADRFLRARGHSLHPALNAARSNTREIAQDVPDGSFGSDLTCLYTDEFKAAIEAYKNSSNDPKVRALEITKKASWEEVIQAAREAEENYVQDGQKRIRKIGRRMSEKASSALPLVSCIPNDMGLAAAAKIGQQRQDVLQALLRIPQVILEADECCEHFGPDPVLSAYAENLYRAALAAIEGTTKWLVSGSNGKPFRAALRGPLYNKSFEGKMGALNDAMIALQRCTSSLRDKAIKSIDRNVQHVQNIAEEVVRTQKEIRVEAAEAETRHARRLEQVSKDAIDEMKKVLADTNRTAKWMEKKNLEIRRLRIRINQVENAAAALTEEDIFEMMDVTRDHPNVDLRRLLRNDGRDSDPDISNIALNIVRSAPFLEWKSEDLSDTLFVEVRKQHVLTNRQISAASLMSSSLIQSLESNPQATILYFFCGHHTSSVDKLRGPQGMMRSLICQLLRWHSYPQIRIDFVTVRLRQQLESLTFKALLECFSKLVKQLPASVTLFCVVDNIHFFATTEWLDNCQDAIDMLQDLVSDTELHAVIKLLVTASGRTRHFGNAFRPECHLVIDGDASDGRSGLTERQMSTASRRFSVRQQNHVLTALRDQDRERSVLNEDDDAWS